MFKIIQRICSLLIICIFTSAHAGTLATGSIFLAKLNSSINNAQPYKLVTATIVDGKYKGLLCKENLLTNLLLQKYI